MLYRRLNYSMDGLSYFALGILFFVVLTLAYGMIAIHDIPYKELPRPKVDLPKRSENKRGLSLHAV